MHKAIGQWLTAAVLLVIGGSAAAANNLRLHGALVAEPCVILPGDEEITLKFGTIIDKYLYLNTRTPGQKFEIRLAECDLSLGKTVTVTLLGTESVALPGLLAPGGGSQAQGIAIGLETLAGKALPFNQASDKQGLQAGGNILALQAYVRGEPQAIERKTIGRGAFSAVATFSLEYE
ncbi:fimbrial protein [Serratia surfactantfaciens]|uniref:Type 1 fimbrial protein n=1 Tax=Serratia surfactantfaciens TaxID=2741499 RepID=A0ABS0M4G5_9GAMM|nr:fimbrial protein [Serratia surfactantfaciens]MBH1922373.1 type 1 fimbrial protein [Serratia surfactantfaciens]